MGFLDSISKTFTSGVDRAKFEADKFQRTSRISGEVNNIKSQIDTNIRQLGERALELYQQGTITAPEVASLAQIIAQLRDQQTQKETELNTAQNETFEAWQATQPQTTAPTSQNVPISTDTDTTYSSGSETDATVSSSSMAPLPSSTSTPTTSTGAPSFTGRTYDMPVSTDMSGSGMPNTSSVGGTGASVPTQSQPAVGNTPYACPNCGYSVPNNAVFCPNCGTRVTQV